MAPEGVTVTVTPIPPVIGGPSSVQSPTSLAPGFRFHPTDEELVTYYLKRKVCGKPFRIEAVAEIDVYKSEPWELAGFSSLKTRDLEWYFFSPVDRKYGNGSRLNRATGQGYWKATGKDRSVRHKSQPIGMKKTLVFHIGRAPDGRRTNWVMHEYRLVDEEIERAGMVQDAFVLCRIFQKSGLGPPNGDRYAPFLDEEWDDDNNGAPPYARGGEADDEMANGDELRVGLNGLEQDKNKGPLLLENSYEPKGIEFLCKRERSDDEDMEILSLGQTKRSKRDDPSSSNPNGSQDSTTTMQDDPMTKMMMTTTTTTTNFSSDLLEFPIELKGNQSSNAPVTFDSSNLEKSVPPGYLKFISNLENEIMNISMEKETLKIEMMRAQATINILQSRIDIFSKENEGLRRAARGGGN